MSQYELPANQGPPPPPGGYGYGAPVPGQGGQPLPTSVMAIISLVTGIIGLIPCFWGCFVFSIAASVLGYLGKKETDAGKKTGGGMAKAGFIMGVIGIVLGVVYWVLFAAGVFDFDFDYYSDF